MLMILLPLGLSGQQSLYWQGGLSFAFGEPINRMGISFKASYFFDQLGITTELAAWYRLTGIGAAAPRWETRTGIGPVFTWGKSTEVFDAEVLIAQTPREWQAKYLFFWYQEKLTAQFSGVIAIRNQSFEIAMENDALGAMGKDRFRTGTLQLNYFNGNETFGLDAILWTGDSHCSAARRVEHAEARDGLKLISDCDYGKISHGILQFNYTRNLQFHQQLGFSLGLDDERIRHVLQNKLMHDWILGIQKKYKNPHLPMLKENGAPCINENDQPRKTKIIWAIFMNKWDKY